MGKREEVRREVQGHREGALILEVSRREDSPDATPALLRYFGRGYCRGKWHVESRSPEGSLCLCLLSH